MFDKYYKVFLQYFNKETLLNDCQPPIYNKYCIVMVHPAMCFTFVDSSNSHNSNKSDDSDDSDDCNDYACFHVKNADNCLIE